MVALSRRLPSSGLIFTALVGLCTAQMDQGDEEIELDMENEKLAVAGAGIRHKWSCFEGDDMWAGSCDLDDEGGIRHPADWAPDCDPWKLGSAEARDRMTFSFGNWTCPVEYRSISGCGDMRTDPRGQACEESKSFDFNRTERIVIEDGEPLVPMKHACVQHPLFYDNFNTAGTVTPPMVGRHRERWPKYGEYEYIPPQRWLHSAEHGAIIFLYDNCMDEESLCLIRSFIRKWEKTFEESPARDKRFRFIMTPFKNIMRPFAMVSWGQLYLSRGFNEWEMDQFVKQFYRHAWEDYAPDGPYDHLWVDIATRKHECTPEVVEKAKKARHSPAEMLAQTAGKSKNAIIANRSVRWGVGWICLASLSHLLV